MHYRVEPDENFTDFYGSIETRRPTLVERVNRLFGERIEPSAKIVVCLGRRGIILLPHDWDFANRVDSL